MKNVRSPFILMTLALLASCQDSGKSSSPIAVSGEVFTCDSLGHSIPVGTQSLGDLVCEGSGSGQSVESITPSNSGLSVSFSGQSVIISATETAALGEFLVKVNNAGAINEISVTVVENEITCADPSGGLPNLSPAIIDVSDYCSHAQGEVLEYELVPGQSFAPLSVSMTSGQLLVSGLGSANIQVKVEAVTGLSHRIITFPITLTGNSR